MRIRDKWRTDKARTLEDTASAIAYIIWQIGLNYTKNLHEEKFDFKSDEQRVDVIKEYLIYLGHLTDRWSFEMLDEIQRHSFISALVDQVSQQYQKNTEAVLGSNDYKSSFLDLTNKRFEAYSKGKFESNLPGYAIRRLLGSSIQNIMGASQTNKWIIQQVIDIDSADAAKKLKKSVDQLLIGVAPTPITTRNGL